MLFEPLRPMFCRSFIQTVCRPLFLVSAVERKHLVGWQITGFTTNLIRKKVP